VAPTEQEIAEYRAALEALMARCLERIRSVEIPQQVEPLQGWSPDE
jgi:hypothetical protein